MSSTLIGSKKEISVKAFNDLKLKSQLQHLQLQANSPSHPVNVPVTNQDYPGNETGTASAVKEISGSGGLDFDNEWQFNDNIKKMKESFYKKLK